MNKINQSSLSPNTVLRFPPRGAEEIELASEQIALGIIIGQVARYFDLSIFAICTVLVFPRLFFPSLHPLIGLLCAFAVFSVAFAARPVGVLLFNWVDHRHGRAVKLISAFLLLCASMVAIGLAPGYDSLGSAAIGILVLARVGQGMAAAGVGDGSVSMLALGSTSGRRYSAVAAQLGVPLGVLLAAGLFAYSANGTSAAEFIAWGWRYPFIIACAVNLMALFARLRLLPAERLGLVYARKVRRTVPNVPER